MAATLNKVFLIGRLGKDPELRYTPAGKAVANFTLATDESYTDQTGNRQDRAEWHNIVVWERQAENCSNYLRKGSLVCIEGSLQTRKWQDQQGQNRYTTEIRAQRVQFLDTRQAAQSAPPPMETEGMPEEPFPGPPQQAAPPRQAAQNRPPVQQRQARPPQPARQPMDDELGPAFPSEASGMDEVPF